MKRPFAIMLRAFPTRPKFFHSTVSILLQIGVVGFPTGQKIFGGTVGSTDARRGSAGMRIELTVFPRPVAAVKVGIGGVRPPCRAAPLPRWLCATARKRADPCLATARHGIASPWANLAPSSLRYGFV